MFDIERTIEKQVSRNSDRPEVVMHTRRKKNKKKYQTKQTPWPLVRKRTISTERPPLFGEI
jgi:hypothetical protein